MPVSLRQQNQQAIRSWQTISPTGWAIQGLHGKHQQPGKLAKQETGLGERRPSVLISKGRQRSSWIWVWLLPPKRSRKSFGELTTPEGRKGSSIPGGVRGAQSPNIPEGWWLPRDKSIISTESPKAVCSLKVDFGLVGFRTSHKFNLKPNKIAEEKLIIYRENSIALLFSFFL